MSLLLAVAGHCNLACAVSVQCAICYILYIYIFIFEIKR